MGSVREKCWGGRWAGEENRWGRRQPGEGRRVGDREGSGSEMGWRGRWVVSKMVGEGMVGLDKG